MAKDEIFQKRNCDDDEKELVTAVCLFFFAEIWRFYVPDWKMRTSSIGQDGLWNKG